MAQGGDTITYTFSDGSSVSEDVSAVDEAVIEYCDGPGGSNQITTGGAGGRVENATIDLSSKDTLYLWVGGTGGGGRYTAPQLFSAGGSSEISFSNTNVDDSDDEPFLVGSGGGGSGYGTVSTPFGTTSGSSDGARGGGGNPANGIAPPKGGDGADSDSDTGDSGDGAIDDQNRGLVSGGTTINGGGSGPDTNGEIKITYQSGPEPPAAPTDLTASIN